MEQRELKFCKMCFKDIDTRAKKCPYCQHWQHKIYLLLYSPVVAVIFLLIILLGFDFVIEDQFGPGKDFDVYRERVSITNSELEFGEDKCGSTVVILGRIKNATDLAWRNLQFEVNFYDQNDQMTDTEQENKFSFTLPANQEIPFKVSVRREFPEERYVSHTVRIVSAKQKGWFF